jgi:uncharacterized tellurite resistance protein B-like protein
MTRSTRVAFLKVLAAAAWADGVLEEAELNRIKVLLNRFDLDGAERREVESLLERPVSFARAVEFAKEFAGGLATPGTRRELVDEVEALLGDESNRSPEESELLEHVRSVISSYTVIDGFVEKVRGLFSRTLFASRTPNRSGPIADLAKTSALTRVAELARERGWEIDASLPKWNRLTLMGILLASVAHLEEGWHGGERAFVERELERRYGVDAAEREVLLTVMEEEQGRDSDLQRVCAELSRITTMAERIDLLDQLFAVGSADERISKTEVEQIHRIADLLWISNPEYLNVRGRYRDRIET